ncbi:MAG: hypothetical protein DBX52_01450 [Clostridiales bacterium]|nr:MAG: hypothetical protein DBX52_01450 [Clostridiales bacterium]
MDYEPNQNDGYMEVQEDQDTKKIYPAGQKSRTTIKYIRYLLLLIMVMVALLFLFANRDQINGDNFRRLMAKINIGVSNGAAENGEVRFDTLSNGNTVVYKDGFAHATVEKLIITDKNGTEFQNTQLGYRKPCIAANNRYVLVYDSGGTGLMVADSFSVLFETYMENNIISAKMNANGYIVVVTEGDGFLAKVFVYDASFREIYRYRSLNRYILDADVSADNKAMALSAMNIEGAEIVPEILYFRFSKEEMDWKVSFEEAPCVEVAIKNDGTVCGLFSWGMVSITSKGAECGRYEFDNQVLQCYSLEDGSMNLFAVSASENGDATIVACDEKGAVKHTVSLDYYGVDMDYCEGRVAVLGNQKCAAYSLVGKLLWEQAPESATGISFMGKSAVVVVSETKCVYNGIG